MATRRRSIALAAGLLALLGSNALGQSGAAPPAAVSASPDDFTVISRSDTTQLVQADDLKLALTKAKRDEHALVRRLIFISAVLRLTEPVAQAGDSPPVQTCRWAYRSFLQRQICFTSMTGLLSCTEQEITPLPDETHGDAPVPAGAPTGACNDVFRPAVTARVRLTTQLLSRAKELFASDQKARVDPLFKAAGVTARPEAPAAAAKAPPPASR
jgi:hypothetical protein